MVEKVVMEIIVIVMQLWIIFKVDIHSEIFILFSIVIIKKL